MSSKLLKITYCDLFFLAFKWRFKRITRATVSGSTVSTACNTGTLNAPVLAFADLIVPSIWTVKDLGIFLSQKKAEDEEPHGVSTHSQTLAGLLTSAITHTGPKLCNWTANRLCNREPEGYRLFNSHALSFGKALKSLGVQWMCLWAGASQLFRCPVIPLQCSHDFITLNF